MVFPVDRQQQQQTTTNKQTTKRRENAQFAAPAVGGAGNAKFDMPVAGGAGNAQCPKKSKNRQTNPNKNQTNLPKIDHSSSHRPPQKLSRYIIYF